MQCSYYNRLGMYFSFIKLFKLQRRLQGNSRGGVFPLICGWDQSTNQRQRNLWITRPGIFCVTLLKHIEIFSFSNFEQCNLKSCLVALFTLFNNYSKIRILKPPPTQFFLIFLVSQMEQAPDPPLADDFNDRIQKISTMYGRRASPRTECWFAWG